MHRAFTIAKAIGGGIETFMWALEEDPFKVEVLLLATNRAAVAEQLASIPANELPTREILEPYRATRPPEEDLAWSKDLFPQLCAWLADRQRKRQEQERRRALERH